MQCIRLEPSSGRSPHTTSSGAVGYFVVPSSPVGGECSGLLLMTQSEVDQISIIPPLSGYDGVVLGMAIGAVWCLAWGFKMIRRAVR